MQSHASILTLCLALTVSSSALAQEPAEERRAPSWSPQAPPKPDLEAGPESTVERATMEVERPSFEIEMPSIATPNLATSETAAMRPTRPGAQAPALRAPEAVTEASPTARPEPAAARPPSALPVPATVAPRVVPAVVSEADAAAAAMTNEPRLVEVAASQPVGDLPPAGRSPPAIATNDLQPISQPNPEYPREAAVARIEGWVDVELTVAADGRVYDARVVAAEPRRTFDRAAVDATRRWRFAPFVGDEVRKVYRIEFSLD